MSHFVRGMIVTSAIGLMLVGMSPSKKKAAPYRGYRHGYYGGGHDGGGYRPYVGVGVYPGYYGGGYGYGGYGYGYPGYRMRLRAITAVTPRGITAVTTAARASR